MPALDALVNWSIILGIYFHTNKEMLGKSTQEKNPMC